MQLGNQEHSLTLFQDFPIRRLWYEGEWWYSIIDVCAALTRSTNPRNYWNMLKAKLIKNGEIAALDGQTYRISVQLKIRKLHMQSEDGKSRLTDCANMEALLRLIQSVNSPNAETIKQWLAQVGADRIDEGEDGETSVRGAYRAELARADRALHELVMFHGIVTPEQHQALTDANYAGLYNKANLLQVVRMRQLPFLTDDPANYMGATELGYHIFQRVLTHNVVQTKRIQGEEEILAVAEDVGVRIRMTIQEAGGMLPEELPRYRFLTRGQWMEEEELIGSGGVDWEDAGETP